MKHPIILFTTLLSLTGMVVFASGGMADPPTVIPPSIGRSPASDPGLTRPADIQQKIEEFDQRLDRLQQVARDKTAARFGVDDHQIQLRIADLTLILSTYGQILNALGVRSSLEQESQEQVDRQKMLPESGLPQSPPYSFAIYDAVLDDQADSKQQEASAEAAVDISRQAIENLSKNQAAADATWRRLNEKNRSRDNTPPPPAAAWELDSARLQADLAGAMLLLEKIQLANHQIEFRNAQLNTDIQKRKIDLIRSHMVFNESDLAGKLESLEKKKIEVERRLQKSISAGKEADAAWGTWEKRHRENQETRGGKAVMKNAETRRTAGQTISELLFDTQRLLGLQQTYWRIRYALTGKEAASETIEKWQNDVDLSLSGLQDRITRQQNDQIAVQSQIADIENEKDENKKDPDLNALLAKRLEALQNLSSQRQAYISVLVDTARLGRKLQNELDLKKGGPSVGRHLSDLRKEVSSVWNYEITDIDNQPVTIRKVVVSIVILIFGIVIAKLLIRYMALRLLKFSRFRETTRSAIQKVVSFTAYLLVFLFALRMVNIPLAAFAFLGGAVAIGVGFGAQTLINNFISGFIIMGERPINIGDLIEVEGILGQVEEIGVRCTRVRTGQNIHILVPNSSLLEKNITNWTLSDKKLRTSVGVGVAYGSPVREVERILVQAADQEERVLKDPLPFVLFNDFGDSALIFEVHFWIRIQKIIERRAIESGVRFRINELFREAGIVIAFPQRDVHFHAGGPIAFRTVGKN